MKQLLVLRHEPDVAMGSLAGVLAEAGLEYRQIDLFDMVPGELPWDEMAGLVVLGGTMHANDCGQFPFLERELGWLREAVRRDLPTLGICLGAQLLAKALGGRVYRNPQPEIGWHRIEVLGDACEDRLFSGRGPVETVFQWHNDTFDLPPGAVHLARSPACANQAFRFSKQTYGLQFHVEMEPELMEHWLRKFLAGNSSCTDGNIDAAAIRAAAPSEFPALHSFSRSLLQRFVKMCALLQV